MHRSGYYKWKQSDQIDSDTHDFELIRKLFIEKKERIGIRQLKMLLQSRFGRILSRKKIARIKIKFGLITKIRRKNRYRKLMLKQHEHRSFPNRLNQEFTRTQPDEVYVTDITELPYGDGRKAYLSVFKDLATKEIISAELSKTTNVDFVNRALDKALVKLTKRKRGRLLVHSDQGYHFTHIGFRMKLKENGVTQSMSRKGNCLDNAPVESFFGHLKDHLELGRYSNFSHLESEVTREIDYYNNERPQWGLKKMPPISYRRHLSSSARAF